MNKMYIENSKRNKRKVISNKYKPEHEKLNVKSVEYPIKDQKDYDKHCISVQNNKLEKEIKDQHKILLQAYKEGRVSKEELDIVLSDSQNEIPISNTIIASGQDQEHLWTKSFEEISNKEVYNDNIEYHSVPTPPTTSHYSNPSTTSPYREVIKEIEEEEEEEIEEEEEVDFNDIKTNHYILISENNILVIGSEKDIYDFLEKNRVTNPVVLKKVNIKYGFFIDD